MLLYLQMIESEADKTKFEQLYLKYRGLMFYVSNQILHNEADAEDAVHLAFESIAKNTGGISEVECLETRSFVVTIVERKAMDILRANRLRIGEELDEATRGIDISLPGDSGLADAIARLPARYREVLLLRFDCGFSTNEIAKMLEMTPGSTQKLVWRAKEALRIALEAEGVAI